MKINLSKVLKAEALNNSTPTSLVLRVDWVGTSPNELRHKHWTEVSQNDNEARDAWSRCVSSLSELQKSMMITLREHIKHFETPSPNPSGLTTATPESGSVTSKESPKANHTR